jgi:hypothetical protein
VTTSESVIARESVITSESELTNETTNIGISVTSCVVTLLVLVRV